MADVGALIQAGMSSDLDQDGSDYDNSYYHDELYGGDTSQLAMLRQNCTSEDVLQRQLAAKSVNYTAKSLQLESEFQMLLQIVNHLSNDSETGVCVELMERLPELCLILLESGVVPFAIPNYILPVIVKYLGDDNSDVRRLAHNGLLKLVDNNIVGRDDVEKQVSDILLQLVEVGNAEEFRTEAVAMITKLAPYVGKELTMRVFFKPFHDLCSDDAFLIRKMCATNFTDIASVVDFDTAEKLFLPLFSQLCIDVVWGVRKTCAETFPSLASCFSRHVRYDSLAPLFVNFFSDNSRWVQMAAYQSLGQFVSTFSDPRRSGFELNMDGVLVPWRGPLEGEEDDVGREEVSATAAADAATAPDEAPAKRDPSSEACTDSSMKDESTDSKIRKLSEDNDDDKADGNSAEGKMAESNSDLNHKYNSEAVDRLTEFDSFIYWKAPLLEVDVPEDLLSSSNEKVDEVEECRREIPQLSIEDSDSFRIRPYGIISYEFGSPYSHFFDGESMEHDSVDLYSNERHSFSEDLPDLVQDVIPPQILYHYISMTRSAKASMIDTDITLHCAYTFPGVVLTLGRRNWHCLKDTYDVLAQNMQWKVRRTLAFSIHHLALLLGEDITVSDLTPVFNEFLKDLDEVRIGVLKHLYEFVSLLPVDFQRDYLPTFRNFLNSDNSRNWRFRQELGRQLILLSGLYDVEEINGYFVPIALALAVDHVAEVRGIAFNVLSVILGTLRDSNQPAFVRKFVAEVIGLCTFHQHWVKRKSCAHACLTFLQHNVEQPRQFAEDFLPGLLTLASDPVPNVRLIAARALSKFITSDYFRSLLAVDNTRVLVETHMRQLQIDEDRDVRFFSGGNRDPVVQDRLPEKDPSSESSPTAKVESNHRNHIVVVQDSSRRAMSQSMSISSGGRSDTPSEDDNNDEDINNDDDSNTNDKQQSPLNIAASVSLPSIQIIGCGRRNKTIKVDVPTAKTAVLEKQQHDGDVDQCDSAAGKSVFVEEIVETYERTPDDKVSGVPGEEFLIEEVVEEIIEEYEEEEEEQP